ncbi:MAG TPA: hypothetical protein VM759_04845, partial [Longimicrobium sp.]|nr:hypothetical protein [Longimicrobium sp.]
RGRPDRCRIAANGAHLAPKRLKPPLGLQEAPSRLAALPERGFNGANFAMVHPDGARHDLSAQADITFSEPRLPVAAG